MASDAQDVDDVFEELVDHLDDVLRDYAENEIESPQFRAGLRYGRHKVREHQLENTRDCDCEEGTVSMAEKLTDGTWLCGDCQTVIYEEDDDE